MDVNYTNLLKASDSFKIEIGYMRRMPVLRSDVYGNFLHIGAKERFDVLTPQKALLKQTGYALKQGVGQGYV
jgi:hypothetical protein